MKASMAKKSGHWPFGGGFNQIASSASTIVKRSPAIIIGGKASIAILARMLFTPQMSAIEINCRKSSGAKAREGVVTDARYAGNVRRASAGF